MKRVLAAGVIAAIAAAALISVAASSVDLGVDANRRSATDVESNRGLLGLLENNDGGDYAAIARDPTLARPDIYRVRTEAAYREQRPLFGELAWVGSLGDPDRVPVTMAVLSVLSAAFAVMAMGVVLARRGMSPFFALGLFGLPGVFTIVYDMMSELLQLGLLTVGLLAWEGKPRRIGWATVAFTAAALTRESSLLVPLVLIGMELPRIRARSVERAIGLLAIPFAAYVSWIAFVRIRVGEWPFRPPSKGLDPVPFRGLVQALQHSPYRGSMLLGLAAGVLVFGYAFAYGRKSVWLWSATVFAAMGVFLGSTVWDRPNFFGRVLLPFYAFGVLVAGSAVWERRAVVTLRRDRTPARSGIA